jgi:SAM-dependent methyltransferase
MSGWYLCCGKERRVAKASDPGAGRLGQRPAAEVDVVANAVYALGASEGESARLMRQSLELAPDSEALLDQVDLSGGCSAIDLGCGPRGIIDLLSERVSPGGRVTGLDADPTHVTMAKQFVEERGLRNIEVVVGDARHTGLQSDSFDLVHARTLLTNIPRPAEVVTEMVRLAKPGGWVAGIEPDTEHAICYPPNPAYDRITAIFPVVYGRNGADPTIGRRIAELYREAGLEDVEVAVRASLYPPGHSRRTIRLDLVQSMRRQVLELGLAEENELDELDAAARLHVADPRTVVVPGLMFLAWGRKPGRARQPG